MQEASQNYPTAIRKHFDELHHAFIALGMEGLATKFFSKGLITVEVKDAVFSQNAKSAGEKANTLLSAIQGRIKIDQSAFDTFVGILESEPAYQPLADKLTKNEAV